MAKRKVKKKTNKRPPPTPMPSSGELIRKTADPMDPIAQAFDHIDKLPEELMPEGPKVLHKHVRILREALARLHKSVPPFLQAGINTALMQYGEGVKSYCQHRDAAPIPARKVIVCLDCGHERPNDKTKTHPALA